MAFLTLNGISLDVVELTRLEQLLIGEENRSESGADLSSVRARKHGWRVKLPPQSQAEAAALRGLVQGEGYSWSFDSDLYADRKGLGPSTSTGCAVEAGGKYGSRVKISGGDLLGYPISGDAAKWTAVYWKRAQSGGAWEHFIVCGDGTKYKNGATTAEDTLINYGGAILYLLSPGYAYASSEVWLELNDYSLNDYVISADGATLLKVTTDNGASGSPEPSWNTAFGATTADGDLIWTSQGEAAGYFDDVRFLPYVVPAAWVAQLYAEDSARAATALPRLRLAGDAAAKLFNGFATVTGKVLDAEGVMGVLSGSFQTTLEPLELELREA